MHYQKRAKPEISLNSTGYKKRRSRKREKYVNFVYMEGLKVRTDARHCTG